MCFEVSKKDVYDTMSAIYSDNFFYELFLQTSSRLNKMSYFRRTELYSFVSHFLPGFILAITDTPQGVQLLSGLF